MYSYGPPHTAAQKQDDQHEHTFSNYVRIRDVVRKTCLRRWTIGKSGERGSGISVLQARHDDDDDDVLLRRRAVLQGDFFISYRLWLPGILLMFSSTFLLIIPCAPSIISSVVVLRCHIFLFPDLCISISWPLSLSILLIHFDWDVIISWHWTIPNHYKYLRLSLE